MMHAIQSGVGGCCSTAVAAMAKRGRWRAVLHLCRGSQVCFPPHTALLSACCVASPELPSSSCSSQRVHVTAAFSAQWGGGNDVVSSELIFSVSVNQAPTVIPVNYFKCKCHIETNVWMRRWMSILEERYFQYTVVVPFVINMYF